MAVWTVFEHEKFEPEERAEHARFVRDGFAWLAMLFPLFWMLANRMWVVFLAALVVSGGIVALVSYTLGPDVAIVASIGLAIWFGFEARALKRWSMTRKGWILSGVVEGRRFRNAERRYFSARLDPTYVAPGASHPHVPSHITPPAPWGQAAPASAVPNVIGVFPEGTR
ncbi:DUF2628 domain-containing protein [Acuticoccus kandeliae]|uniref:DUF2628 domain-containing protein n=1 Tax=Acuticoccus kandeliae TaxID=2073160 RepID=UPI000D3E925D|nr:DUF2628 domain-containing protein [Acuticoccus kandeliae]